MNYIWYKYNPKNKYIIADNKNMFSPYLENCYLADKPPYRIVNPNIRFSKIFNNFVQNLPEKERQEIENILFHYLAQLDRKTGIDRNFIEEYILEKDILAGKYGASIVEDFSKLPHNYKKNILYFLRKQQKKQGREYYFRQVIKAIYPRSALYFNNNDKFFLVYLPQKENEQDKSCLQVIQHFFLDVTAQMRVFWRYHFGIIGRAETMKVGNIAVY